MRLPRRIVRVSSLAYLVACSGGDSGGTGPTPKIASSIGISAGTNQSVEVATAVPVAPAVVVRDQNGDPMSGVDVTFTVQSGGGTHHRRHCYNWSQRCCHGRLLDAWYPRRR